MKPDKINTFDKLQEILGDELKHEHMLKTFITTMAARGTEQGAIYLYNNSLTGYIISWVRPEDDARKELIAYGYWNPSVGGYRVQLCKDDGKPEIGIDILHNVMREVLTPPYEIGSPSIKKGDTNG